MHLKLREFLKDDLGATAIEYGLIAAGLSVALITLLGHAGEDLKVMFDYLRHTVASFTLRPLS